jgi:peptide/nickel transport system permease protein
MAITGYVGKRLLQMLPSLFGITLIIFLMLRLIPGDPVAIMLGERATAAQMEQLREALGLTKTIPEQYVQFMGNLLRGNLGVSLIQRRPVLDIVAERLPITIFLVIYTMVVSLSVTVPLAIIAALNRDRAPDQLIRIGFTFTMAMPGFWVGLLLMLLFAVRLKLFPISGFGDNFGDQLHHLFLPALTISCTLAAMLTRSLRSSLIDVLRAPYVEFAHAQGLRGRLVLGRYVLRNALIATISILGVNVGWLLSGSVIIETVFSIPGIGSAMISAIFARDYPIVQGITLMFGLLVLAVNLLTDLSYALLDPRVSYD